MADLPKGIGRPAAQALSAAGVQTLEALTQWTEGEVAALHGVGPKAVSLLRTALTSHGLGFADASPGR